MTVKERNSQDVPPGRLMMGSDDGFYPEEGPTREIDVTGGKWDVAPVTVAQWRDFISDSGYTTDAEKFGGSVVFLGTEGPVALDDWSQWWGMVEGAYWAAPQGPAAPLPERFTEHPVVHVSYRDALEYCRWAGAELPDEAEWEWAARGGLVGATYSWGEEANKGDHLRANSWQGDFPYDNRGAAGWRGTSPVGTFPANGYGLLDMTGNVWEWTRTTWEAAPGVGCACSGTTIEEGLIKTIKGGSHLCSPQYCLRYRPAARSPQEVTTSTSHIGFRCIRPRSEAESSKPQSIGIDLSELSTEVDGDA